jgi:hypothetical protein
MTNYAELNVFLPHLSRTDADTALHEVITPLLVDLWANDYLRRFASCELIEASVGGFSYLFDVSTERLVAAWGISQGKSNVPRKEIATRMRGHPLSNGGVPPWTCDSTYARRLDRYQPRAAVGQDQ